MFDLAGHLGMTVAELGDRLTSSELSEWIALLAVEPWGPYRQDLLNAISCYASAAPWCKNTKVSDWIPRFDKHEPDRDSILTYWRATGASIHGDNQ